MEEIKKFKQYLQEEDKNEVGYESNKAKEDYLSSIEELDNTPLIELIDEYIITTQFGGNQDLFFENDDNIEFRNAFLEKIRETMRLVPDSVKSYYND